MTTTPHILGIDFGTSNSYFSKYVLDEQGHKVRAIDFGHGQLGGIPTTILYRKNKSPLIGSIAEAEWGESTPEERKHYTLRSQFKPEIAMNTDAFQHGVDYLARIAAHLQERRIDFFPEKENIIMGVPAEADPAFRDSLKHMALEAGYGDINLLDEPIGALLYHLWNKDISPEEAQGGVLVIDFGGGTCDFAYMQRLEVCYAWGDMMLGGRLFDDLFYQWLLSSNPGLHAELVGKGDEFYVHWIICRRAKEHFSDSIRHNREEIVRATAGQIRHYGTFSELTWDAFKERARHYTPHQSFVALLNETQVSQSQLDPRETVDLIEWFRQTLVSGIEKYGIKSSDVERVILTGGSSQWVFVEEIVSELLHVKPEQMLMSENPKAAICEGLVIFPSLKKKYDVASDALHDKMDTFFTHEIDSEISYRIDRAIENILDRITVELYDNQIYRKLYEFREEGGTLASLKQNIDGLVLSFDQDLRKIVQDQLQLLSDTLPALLFKKMERWFTDNGVNYYGKTLNQQALLDSNSSELLMNSGKLDSLDDEMIEVIGGIAIAISATIAGILSGGAGTALIASGPVGMIIGAVAAIIGGYVVLEVGKDQAKDYVEHIPLPSWTLKMVLRDSKIESILEEGKAQLQSELQAELKQNLAEPLQDIKKQMRRNIQREIDSLSVLNHL